MGLAQVILIGALAGLATAAGGLIAGLLPIANEKSFSAVFGFAGGVMLGLSLFQLMPEGYFFARGVTAVCIGFIIGIGIIALLSTLLNGRGINENEINHDYKKTGLIIALALALHNFPEGIAIGVGFAGGNNLGFLIAMAMFLHNVPEGIGIGAPLKKGGSNFAYILLLTTITGLVTPCGTALGWLIGRISMSVLAASMGMAAGAMVFVSLTKLLKYRDSWNNLGAFCGILLTFIIA